MGTPLVRAPYHGTAQSHGMLCGSPTFFWRGNVFVIHVLLLEYIELRTSLNFVLKSSSSLVYL